MSDESVLIASVKVRVRYAETDQMSVAYHGSYLPWLEVARTEALRVHGLPYSDLEREGFLLPVVEVQVHYRKPFRYDDEVEITARLHAPKGIRIDIDYDLSCAGEIRATARTRHVFMDRNGRPLRPPQKFIELITGKSRI